MDEQAKSAPSKPETTQITRRAFAKGVIPAVTTLAAKPAWAINCTQSGQLSGNLSDANSGEVCAGEGCAPSFWKVRQDLWHYTFQPADSFNQVFGVTVFSDNVGGGEASLQQVIENNNLSVDIGGCTPNGACKNSYKALGEQAIAALQNAATRVKFDLSVDDVINNVQTALLSENKTDIDTLKTSLEGFNNQGCPF